MGMDPVRPGEMCEVTIVVEGGAVGISAHALKEFKKLIDKAVDDAGQINDPSSNKKLQVRLTRLIIR